MIPTNPANPAIAKEPTDLIPTAPLLPPPVVEAEFEPLPFEEVEAFELEEETPEGISVPNFSFPQYF